MCSRLGIHVLFAIASALAAYGGQQPTFSIDVNVVNVYATVRDRSGELVTDLGEEEFVLEEDGEAQEIEYFSRQADVPLTLGLLVDTSVSQRRIINRQRRASAQFLRQVLRPMSDRAFVIKFDFEIELLQDVTGSPRDLRYAINDLRAPRFGARVSRPRRVPPRGGAIGTSMYDAVYLASGEIMQNLEGRKALILISDGVDMGSLTALDTAIEFAQRADSIVYSIRYYDPYGYFRAARGLFGGGPGKKGSKTLRRLARQTGGRAFEVNEDLTLEQIFDAIQRDLRSQYSIGYTSEPGDYEFRKIKLRTKRKGLTVQTRAGYYPKN